MEFRTIAARYDVSEPWIDKVERHFAEMSPTLLSGLHGPTSVRGRPIPATIFSKR